MLRTLAALLAVAFSTAAFANGANTFNQKCRACHGPNGAGSKVVPRSIAGTPAEQVRKAILYGQGEMRPVKIANVDEVANYVAALNR
jgi:mono/diheme cytochrome c family protein